MIKVVSFSFYQEMAEKMADAVKAPKDEFFEEWLATRPQRVKGDFKSTAENITAVCKALHITPSQAQIEKAVKLNEDFIHYELLNNIKEDAQEVLRWVKERGLKVGLMTDCYHTTVKVWPLLPIAVYFDAEVFSCASLARKPDPALYKEITAKLGVLPSECIYVGDGGGREIEGADAMGMLPVLVENPAPDPFLEFPLPPVRHKIKKLSELKAIISDLSATAEYQR